MMFGGSGLSVALISSHGVGPMVVPVPALGSSVVVPGSVLVVRSTGVVVEPVVSSPVVGVVIAVPEPVPPVGASVVAPVVIPAVASVSVVATLGLIVVKVVAV